MENASRLVEVMSLLESSHIKEHLTPLQPRAASTDELRQVHTAEHISKIEMSARAGGGWLDSDTVTSKDSYEVALYAAGGAITAADAVMNGEVNSAFALVRPPGHHATYQRAMGFCLFNNIAIATKHALSHHKLDRILIADFDVHHGNATQDTFYNNPHVLYFSTHQYPFYPGTGGIEEIGEGEGVGSTINVPLPAGCGDREYLHAYNEILIPAARRFQPQLILVSAGYDAHWADDISLMEVSTTGYAHVVGILKKLAEELCQGRLAFTLEGGYHHRALPSSVKATLDILMENPGIDDPLGKIAEPENPSHADTIIQAVKRIHKLG
jgi:acetoin utilization deacetylase AcuC-like enzyme